MTSRTARSRQILLVDDDEHILRSLMMYLQAEGFEVVVALDGKEALQAVEVARPDLVVLDVMMPELDGFGVLEKLKATAATRAIPVIMLTAKGQDQDVMRGFNLGAQAYMSKPVNYAELVDNMLIIFEDEEMAITGHN
ncbi:MAG: DNA-binding response regulator [Proteobacteria bacterium]|nr:DNA-binding response regulator [Pseudomonadota bacterium]